MLCVTIIFEKITMGMLIIFANQVGIGIHQLLEACAMDFGPSLVDWYFRLHKQSGQMCLNGYFLLSLGGFLASPVYLFEYVKDLYIASLGIHL